MLIQLIALDVRTMIGVLFWGNLASATLIYSYQAINKKGYDRELVTLLFTNRFLFSLYYLLVFYRGIIPYRITANITDSLLFACFYIEGYLMLMICKNASSKAFSLLKALLIISVVLFNFIDILYRDDSLRAILNSLFIFVILVMPVCMLMFTRNIGRFARIVSSFYMFLLIMLLTMFFYSSIANESFTPVNSTIQSLTYIVLFLITIFSPPAFLLIMKEQSDITIERLAVTDGLTGIANRQSFMSIAQTHFDQHKEYGSELAILFLDIDFFKKVNDEYGHSFGDEVLIRLSDTIMRNMRESDISCRYGGEEFLSLLPRSGEINGVLISERIMNEVSKLEFNAHPGFSFTISIGIHAGVPENGDTLLSFINKSDIALYEAKRTGRNKIVVYRDGMGMA